jgi:hypothetical protein
VLGGVAVGRVFEPQSDLELSFAKILIYISDPEDAEEWVCPGKMDNELVV